MSKLPQISGRKCVSALQKIGFYVVRQRGSHITMRRDEPRTRVVIPNHKTIKKGMLRQIIKDADLEVDEFIKLL
jgi:predicted RNA binding protein YcfA (HicA-like mRNA interferase family)